MLCFCCGAETVFHHMNAYAVNFKLKNREALMLKTLNDIEIDSDAATANLHSLMSKIASFREISPSEATTLTAEEVGIELGTLIDSSSEVSQQLENFREEIVTLGQDAIKLYSNTDIGLELDTVMQSIVTVFTALKALFTPVIKACSLDPDDLEEDIAGHNGHALRYLQACCTVASYRSNLNANLGFHSDYMHALIAPDHLDAQCLHAICQYQMHNSRFSAEASEANHRIMRNILNRLQGFSERAVGNASMQRFFGEVLF